MPNMVSGTLTSKNGSHNSTESDRRSHPWAFLIVHPESSFVVTKLKVSCVTPTYQISPIEHANCSCGKKKDPFIFYYNPRLIEGLGIDLRISPANVARVCRQTETFLKQFFMIVQISCWQFESPFYADWSPQHQQCLAQPPFGIAYTPKEFIFSPTYLRLFLSRNLYCFITKTCSRNSGLLQVQPLYRNEFHDGNLKIHHLISLMSSYAAKRRIKMEA